MLIQLADQRHESELCKLLYDAPMPGWVRLAFGREPDFFQAIGVQGKFNQVLIAVEQERVVGMGCRSIKPVLVNGVKVDIGYLSGLRLRPEVRRTSLLARGYAALKKLHEQRPVPACLTTVMEDNIEARRLLTSHRAGLPHYLDQGRYITHAINLNTRRRNYASPFEIRQGDSIGLESILRFLHEIGGRRQFFPALEAADFQSDYLRGLRQADFRLVMNGAEIVGAAIVWDQSAFKQNIVQGYGAPIGILRPVLNGALRLAGFRPLPARGKALNFIYVAFACVRDDDPEIMRALLEHIYAEQQNGEKHYLLWGLHERDPLRAAARHFMMFRYTSRFYLACWDDGLDFVRRLDPARVPHLELATL